MDQSHGLTKDDKSQTEKENSFKASEKAKAKEKDDKPFLVNPDLKPPGGIEHVEFLTETFNVAWLEICGNYPCQKNSTCVVEGNEPRCDCPLGTTGKFCEDEIVVRYPKLNGRGYLAFPVLRDAYKQFRIYLEIKPESPNGLLLFASEKPDARGDFFSVALVDGQVEFRFDCGKGMVAIRSVGRVQLDHWNSIFVQRELRHGFVQLNSENAVEGKIETDFSRITLRQDLFLGGFNNMSAISKRVGTTHKFSGCIQELVINNRKYDMRKDPLLGNAIHGTNVMECSANVCTAVVCENSGKCAVKSADTHICLCPLGYVGSNCETKSTLHVPSFNGHSFLKYHGLDRSTLSFTEVEMIVKPTSLDGLILYNGYTLDRKGDFLMLAMSGGHLEFRFDLGTGPAIIRSPHAVSLGNWHIVKLSRTGRDGILEVDNQPRAEGLSQGAYTQLTLLQDLYIGGHQNFDETSKYANISTSFSGCIQKVVINEKPLDLFKSAKEGVNIYNCDHPCQGRPCMNEGVCVPRHDNYNCYCPLGFQGNNCQKKSEKINDAQFSGGSYLMYKSTPFVKRTRGNKIDIQMWVKPEKRDGLLFWVGKEQRSAFSDYLAIGFVESILQFRYNLGSGEVIISYNATNFFDGSWHFVRVQRDKQDGYLLVDNQFVFEGSSPGTFSSLNTDKKIYIGGMPDIVHHTRRRFTSGFHGCLTDFTLGTDLKVDLVEQADVGQNVWQCS
ncbi:pikachurinpikachurin-like [Octopus vulgaris]|uniref:Pikachurinpikachurin-like n=1 Tax=Octopus vulgaris TaxID=6645 RepID=A0AA36B527_OCTVU|nr:pikachurinpikachurin-like [Octopus vulgaris]